MSAVKKTNIKKRRIIVCFFVFCIGFFCCQYSSFSATDTGSWEEALRKYDENHDKRLDFIESEKRILMEGYAGDPLVMFTAYPEFVKVYKVNEERIAAMKQMRDYLKESLSADATYFDGINDMALKFIMMLGEAGYGKDTGKTSMKNSIRVHPLI